MHFANFQYQGKEAPQGNTKMTPMSHPYVLIRVEI